MNRRLAGNALASFFLDRASVKMPAFEKHLQPGDVSALWAYVTWLRADTRHETATIAKEHEHE